jgi:hypothetical protein
LRYGNAQVAADAVPATFASGDKRLLGLVLDEILSPSLDPPAPEVILRTIDEYTCALATRDGQRLAERLADGTALDGRYEAGRPTLLAWLISQPGKIGEDAALSVVAGEIAGSENANVRQASYARCQLSRTLLTHASTIINDSLQRAERPETWQHGSEFVEQACRDEQSAPTPVRPIVQRLVATATSFCSSPQFADTFRHLASDCAVDEIQSSLSTNMADLPGARAILGLLPELRPASRRAEFWATAVRTQQALWPVLQQHTADWDEAEWKRVLRALASSEQEVYRPALDFLVAAAPIALTSQLIRLVMAQVQGGDSLITTVGQRLGERLSAIGPQPETRDEWVAAVHWPRRRDDEGIEKFRALIACLESGMRTRLLIRGFLTERVPVTLAARLVEAGEVGDALGMVRRGNRGDWAAALADAYPNEIAAAASDVTPPEDYDLDVVAALAPTRPEVAFADVPTAWTHLGPQQRDDLVELLEEYGTADAIGALCTVIEDDHRDNSKRRGRAARRIGALLEPGAVLPDPLLDLLNSNRPDLREAAVEAIARVKPREPDLIDRLHAVAASGGAAGKAAANALDALAREFLTELAETTEKNALHGVIGLLGAVGRPEVLGSLFEYVGSNAVYDDPALHEEAATAIHRAADRIEGEVSNEDQEALVALIDGEEQETGIAARDHLSSALARVQLGDDAALKVLYDIIEFTPKVSPDRLFGSEKEPLVRQLALYERARTRGQDGWGAELAHLDNIAERLVRAAYVVADGASASIAEQIKNDSHAPDYGNLINALASTKDVNRIQGPCKVLHDSRCTFSEIPHAGKPASTETMTTARECFKDLAKVCVGVAGRRHSA